MTFFSTISFAAAMFILAATPGPGIFATVSRALASGFFPALFVIIGIVTGDIIYLMVAVFGISFIAQAAGESFIVVKVSGALYLLYLGIKIWRFHPQNDQSKFSEEKESDANKEKRIRKERGEDGDGTQEKRGRVKRRVIKRNGGGNYVSGLLITLSNPKVILFYSGFLPTFVDLSSISRLDMMRVIFIVVAVLFSVLAMYAYLADQAGTFFSKGQSMVKLNRVAGWVMVVTSGYILFY